MSGLETHRAEEIAAQYIARQGDEVTELDQLIQDAILGCTEPKEDISVEETAEVSALIAKLLAGTSKQHTRRRQSFDTNVETLLEQLQERQGALRIIKQGKLLKEGTTALVRRSTWREAILLNQALILAECKEDSQLILKQIVWFQVGIKIDLRTLQSSSFEIITPERTLRFLQADQDSSLSIWALAIAQALGDALSGQCCRHEIVIGTMWWFALYAPLEDVEEDSTFVQGKSTALLDKLDANGVTACHLAASKGHRSIALRILLSAGADASAAAGPRSIRPGETPLHVAARCGETRNAALLVAFGADASKTDARGETPFEAAVGSGLVDSSPKRKHLLRMLPRPSLVPGALHLCARRGLANNVRALISLGFYVDELDLDGDSPLHAAAAVPHTESALSALFDAGAKPNKKNAQHQSPLDLALDPKLSGSTLESNALVIAAHGGRSAASSCSGTPTKTDNSSPTISTKNEQHITSWPNRQLPPIDTDKSTLHSTLSAADKSKWTPDSAHNDCPFCEEPFNNINRRKHHCRYCGHLCCAPCSTKKVHLYFTDVNMLAMSISSSSTASGERTPPASSTGRFFGYSKKSEPPAGCGETPYWSKERVCDSCFNRLDGILSGRIELDETDDASDSFSAEIPANVSSPHSDNSTPLTQHEIRQRQANDTAQHLADLGNELRQRGEKLENIADRSAEMANAAQQFRENTRRLRQAYEKKQQRSRFAGFFF